MRWTRNAGIWSTLISTGSKPPSIICLRKSGSLLIASNASEIRFWRSAGVDFGKVVVSRLPQNLAGKAIVVTGTLANFSREEAEAAIKDRGGKSPGSVSAKTFAVAVGADPGASKLTKATDLGIPILDDDGFAYVLETGELPPSSPGLAHA